MSERTYILISVPSGFVDKMSAFLHNLNSVNSDKDPPVKIEEVYIKKKQKFAIIPKEPAVVPKGGNDGG